jgi:hypothetical protein
MDYTMQKAAELGVTRIQPVISEYCQQRYSGERAEKRLEHWRGVAIAACEQCRQHVVDDRARNGKANTYKSFCSVRRKYRAVDADKFALKVDQSSSRVALIDCGIGLKGPSFLNDLSRLREMEQDSAFSLCRVKLKYFSLNV